MKDNEIFYQYTGYPGIQDGAFHERTSQKMLEDVLTDTPPQMSEPGLCWSASGELICRPYSVVKKEHIALRTSDAGTTIFCEEATSNESLEIIFIQKENQPATSLWTKNGCYRYLGEATRFSRYPRMKRFVLQTDVR